METSNLTYAKGQVTFAEVLEVVQQLGVDYELPCGKKTARGLVAEAKGVLEQHQLLSSLPQDGISRAAFAVLLDHFVDPFGLKPVDHFGNLQK